MRISHIAAGIFAAGVLTASMPAMAMLEAPPVMHEGNITYTTGGIGADELNALKSERHKYVLHVINEGRNGAFVGDAHVMIKNARGHNMVSADAGPLFYATLPPGKYTVQTRIGQRIQSKPVRIASNQPINLRFFW